MRSALKRGAAAAPMTSREQLRNKPLPQRLDRLIHDRIRLAILAALAASETMSFTDLKAVTGTTDGNLSVHARRLEDAGAAAVPRRPCSRRIDT